MAKLKEYNGKFCEWEFEAAFISALENEQWIYLQGKELSGNILHKDDLGQFIATQIPILPLMK